MIVINVWYIIILLNNVCMLRVCSYYACGMSLLCSIMYFILN